jgi:hypothetical protein
MAGPLARGPRRVRRIPASWQVELIDYFLCLHIGDVDWGQSAPGGSGSGGAQPGGQRDWEVTSVCARLALRPPHTTQTVA